MKVEAYQAFLKEKDMVDKVPPPPRRRPPPQPPPQPHQPPSPCEAARLNSRVWHGAFCAKGESFDTTNRY